MAPGEVLDIPEFQAPTSTGAAPVVVNVGPFITPIPSTADFDFTQVFAIGLKELVQGTGGWQTTTEPTTWDVLTAQQPWLDQIQPNWDLAIAQAGSMLDGETAQAYGQRVHQLFEAINNADPIMVAAGVKAEVTIKSNGESGYFGRPLGSQVLDLELTQGMTLYYVDGKTGNNSISRQYLKDLASKVQVNGVDTIVAITVKK